MPPARRVIIPRWLKDIARTWRIQEGLTIWQIQARLVFTNQKKSIFLVDYVLPTI